MQTAQELGLMSQKEYALHARIPESYVTELKQKGRIIFRPDPKTGKPKVDAEATDIILGKKAAPDFNEKLNKAADEKIEMAITEKNASAMLVMAKAKNEELDYQIKSGQYLRKADVERADFEKARITRDKILAVADRNCDILAIKDNPHDIKIYLKEELTKALNEIIKELEILAEEDE